MPKYRQDRINDSVTSEMAIILREVKDPRVSGELVTITAAKVTPDLKYAKIYFSSFGGDTNEILKGLKSASGFIRTQLAKRLNLRITPELSFYHDSSIEYGAKIASIMKDMEITPIGGDDDDIDEDEETEDSGDDEK